MSRQPTHQNSGGHSAPLSSPRFFLKRYLGGLSAHVCSEGFFAIPDSGFSNPEIGFSLARETGADDFFAGRVVDPEKQRSTFPGGALLVEAIKGLILGAYGGSYRIDLLRMLFNNQLRARDESGGAGWFKFLFVRCRVRGRRFGRFAIRCGLGVRGRSVDDFVEALSAGHTATEHARHRRIEIFIAQKTRAKNRWRMGRELWYGAVNSLRVRHPHSVLPVVEP